MPAPMPAAAVEPSLDASLRRLTRRAGVAIFLGTSLRWLGGVSLALGAVVLVLRAQHLVAAVPIWVPALVPLPALVLGLLAARRRRMGRAAAAAWLDVHAGGSGRLLTGVERPDPSWDASARATLAHARRPPVLRVAGPARWALGGLGFLAAAVLVPIPEPELGPSPAFVEGLTEGLARRLAALSANVNLDEEVARDLAERLERLTDQAGDAPGASLFEALDRLEERFGQEGERAGSLAAEALDSLRAGLESGDLGSPDARAGLEHALSLAREAGLDRHLPAALEGLLGGDLSLPPGLALDGELGLELSEGLARLLQERVGALAAAGLLEASREDLAERFAALQGMLPAFHRCDGDCPPDGCPVAGLAQGLGSARGDAPEGSGGVGEGGGPGSSPRGDEPGERTQAFEARALSPAEYLDAERSGTFELAATAPEVEPQEESAGLVDLPASAGGAAWRRRLAPRHRSAVRAFFGGAVAEPEVPDAPAPRAAGADDGRGGRR